MLPERDSRALRSVHRAGLNRYCARVLEECAAATQDTASSPHDGYLRLIRLVTDRNAKMAAAFDDLRRSTAIQRLASMIGRPAELAHIDVYQDGRSVRWCGY